MAKLVNWNPLSQTFEVKGKIKNPEKFAQKAAKKTAAQIKKDEKKYSKIQNKLDKANQKLEIANIKAGGSDELGFSPSASSLVGPGYESSGTASPAGSKSLLPIILIGGAVFLFFKMRKGKK